MILIFGVIALFFLTNLFTFIGGIWLVGRGKKVLGFALLGMFAGFYALPQIYSYRSVHRTEQAVRPLWLQPDAPLELTGRSVLCLSSESDGVSGLCSGLFEAHEPAKMIWAQVSDLDEDVSSMTLEGRDVLRLRRDDYTFDDGRTFIGSETEPEPGRGLASEFDVILDQRDLPEGLAAQLGFSYASQLIVYDFSRQKTPVARVIDGYVRVYDLIPFFDHDEQVPRWGADPFDYREFLCALKTNEYCYGQI